MPSISLCAWKLLNKIKKHVQLTACNTTKHSMNIKKFERASLLTHLCRLLPLLYISKNDARCPFR